MKYNLTLNSKLNEDGTPIVESEIISWANNKVLWTENAQDNCLTLFLCEKLKYWTNDVFLSWVKEGRAPRSNTSKTRRTRQRCQSSISLTPWRLAWSTTPSSRLAPSWQERYKQLQLHCKCRKNVFPPSGLPFQRKVRRQHGSKDWSSSVCPTWRYKRGDKKVFFKFDKNFPLSFH